jgi:hypothetical protein
MFEHFLREGERYESRDGERVVLILEHRPHYGAYSWVGYVESGPSATLNQHYVWLGSGRWTGDGIGQESFMDLVRRVT